MADGRWLSAVGKELKVKCRLETTRIFDICGARECVRHCDGHGLGASIHVRVVRKDPCCVLDAMAMVRHRRCRVWLERGALCLAFAQRNDSLFDRCACSVTASEVLFVKYLRLNYHCHEAPPAPTYSRRACLQGLSLP